MDYIQERNNILQPTSWETVVALEAQLPLEDLTSATPPSALHAAACAFILNVQQHPTMHNTKELADCISTYNRRLEKWQERQEELREEQEDDDEEYLDELEEQSASFAAQSNVLLGGLVAAQQKIDYYQGLLPLAQKAADDTAFLWDQIPTDLSPKQQRESFAKLLQHHAVPFTPANMVETIRRCAQYYRLQYALLLADATQQNFNTLGYRSAQETLVWQEPFTLTAYSSWNTTSARLQALNTLPAKEDLEMFLEDLSFSPQEENYVDAWYTLQEEFPLPPNFPLDDAYNAPADKTTTVATNVINPLPAPFNSKAPHCRLLPHRGTLFHPYPNAYPKFTTNPPFRPCARSYTASLKTFPSPQSPPLATRLNCLLINSTPNQ